MTSYTPDALHRLLQTLVAPTWRDRRTADHLLFQLFAACGGHAPDPAFAVLVDAATEAFDARRDAFLAHLFAFYCNTVASRHRGGDAAMPAWQPLDAGTEFALHDAAQPGAFDVYGLGTGWYLCSQSARLHPLVPHLTLALRHPAPVVVDVARAVLGAIARAAPPAFDAALQIAFEAGPLHSPGVSMQDLAHAAGADPCCMQVLVASINVDARDRRIAAICAITDALTSVPPELFAALSAALRRTDVPEHRYMLLHALSAASARSRKRDIDALLDTARRYARSAVVLERAASAWALAHLGSPPAHAPALIALLADDDWLVRSHAAAAASRWTDPPPGVVEAVARLLGDVDGDDGYPHDNALSTLAAWGAHAAAAVPQIERWLRLGDTDPADMDALPGLLDALGEHGRPLAAAVAAALAHHYPHRGPDLDDVERFEHDTDHADVAAAWQAGDGAASGIADAGPVWSDEIADLQHDLDAIADDVECLQRDVAVLVARLGIDPDENIPGAPADQAAGPDAEAKLRCWLEGVAAMTQIA